MKTLPILIALAAGVISAHAVQAQQESEVRAAIERHYTAIHANDMEAVLKHHLSDFSFFQDDGRPLRDIASEARMARV